MYGAFLQRSININPCANIFWFFICPPAQLHGGLFYPRYILIEDNIPHIEKIFSIYRTFCTNYILHTLIFFWHKYYTVHCSQLIGLSH